MAQVSLVRVISWSSHDERISSTFSPLFPSTFSSSHSSLTSCTSSCTSSTTCRAVASLCTPPERRWTLLTTPTSSQKQSRGETAGEASQRRGNHVKSEMRRSTRCKNNLGENSAVGAPSCGYHTRGTGRIPRENNESGERREQYMELGVHFISRSTRHDALRLQHVVGT